jgi:hypothetical protein
VIYLKGTSQFCKDYSEFPTHMKKTSRLFITAYNETSYAAHTFSYTLLTAQASGQEG